MLAPVLIGGGLAGILSGIPIVNCLCCMWIIGGAMLSAHLLSKNSPVRFGGGEGAIVGIFTGMVSSVVFFAITMIINSPSSESIQKAMDEYPSFFKDFPEEFFSMIEGGIPIHLLLLSFVLILIVFSVLGALGGILGMSLFGKKTVGPAHDKGELNEPEDSSDRQS